MNKLLKGNYHLTSRKTTPEGTVPPPEVEAVRDPASEFEQRALERLGGSIAFVLKRNTFVWNGEPKDRGSAG